MTQFKPELQVKIMQKIKRHERRMLVVRIAGFGSLLLGSLSMLVAAYLNLVSAFAQSGFFSYAGLFFSDFGTAMANFQDFAFSIIESFPVFPAAFLVAGLIAVVWSAAHFMDDVTRVRAQGIFARS
jgi:hypothetical protein